MKINGKTILHATNCHIVHFVATPKQTALSSKFTIYDILLKKILIVWWQLNCFWHTKRHTTFKNNYFFYLYKSWNFWHDFTMVWNGLLATRLGVDETEAAHRENYNDQHRQLIIPSPRHLSTDLRDNIIIEGEVDCFYIHESLFEIS